MKGFHGFMYPVQNITDIALALLQVSDYRFEALCYIAKEKSLKKTKKRMEDDDDLPF